MSDRPLTMDEAAEALRVSRRWLQGFLKEIDPCWLQAGSRKLFDQEALAAIKEAMRQKARDTRPSLFAARRGARPTGAFGARNTGSTLTAALAMANAGKGKRRCL